MRFGPLAVAEAIGAVSVHGLRAGDVTLRKGAVITEETARRLEAAGIARVIAARLDGGDVGEDEAAGRIARLVAGEGIRVDPPFTGRANLFAEAAGILLVAREGVDALNAIDEAVTLATLPAFRPVVAGEMVGTVKIIPYAVAGSVLAKAGEGAASLLSLAPYRRGRVAAISTLTPGFKPSIVEKTLAALRARLAPAGAGIVLERRVPHEREALAAALREIDPGAVDLVVVYGASAIADRRDVIPGGLEDAGGRIEHLGMPVDPGNLLLVGSLGELPVVGAPGCARSPKENGFDWVLARLLAGVPVTRRDITGMGVGGLLMEIVSRGQPRAGGESGEEP